MNKRKLLEKLTNSQKNVRYSDFVALIEAFGFEYDRTKGSHTMYKHMGVPKIMNIQDDKGQAKPYQIRQLLDMVKNYNLKLEGEDDE